MEKNLGKQGDFGNKPEELDITNLEADEISRILTEKLEGLKLAIRQDGIPEGTMWERGSKGWFEKLISIAEESLPRRDEQDNSKHVSDIDFQETIRRINDMGEALQELGLKTFSFGEIIK